MSKYGLIAINIEPTPYKVDLFNAFGRSDTWKPYVLYTQSKDFSAEAGHDFQEFPDAVFPFEVLTGSSPFSWVLGLCRLLGVLSRSNADFTIVCGYSGAHHLLALCFLILTGKSYALWADLLNNDPPRRGGSIVRPMRNLVRKVIFRTATLLMMCGRPGRQSAIEAGCPPEKVIDFPYVVDSKRLESSPTPTDVPEDCRYDVARDCTIILFSGRHIERKGLASLLSALGLIRKTSEWTLWIEGDGPLRQEFEKLAADLNIADRCRFLGFCQMNLHNWLLRHADVVTIPSLHDPWGIVVDEAMQLGKAVCASRSVGSALDRIHDGETGVLFEAGNSRALAEQMERLILDPELRTQLGLAARAVAAYWNPERNVEVFTQFLTTVRPKVFKQ